MECRSILMRISIIGLLVIMFVILALLFNVLRYRIIFCFFLILVFLLSTVVILLLNVLSCLLDIFLNLGVGNALKGSWGIVLDILLVFLLGIIGFIERLDGC